MNSPNIGGDDVQIPGGASFDYERVWICEQVQNRPYFMRVTFMTQVKTAYSEAREGSGAEQLVKSIGALRNYLQQSDRAHELPLQIKTPAGLERDNSGGSDEFTRAQITTDTGYFITDALEFIEDEAANNTINVLGEDAASGDEDESRVVERPTEAYVENYDAPKFLWDVERVPDWSRRTAAYNEEQLQFYKTMVPKIQELKNIVASRDGWSLLVDNPNDDYKIETKKSVRGFTIARGQGTIDWPAVDVLRCMGYWPVRQEWDINNDVSEYRKKVGANAFYFYSRSKSRTGFGSRDFVVSLLYNEEEDGTLLWASSSIGCPYTVPE